MEREGDMSGIERIAAERERQIKVEGWTPEHDDKHSEQELSFAAACYAAPKPIFAWVTRPMRCGCREAICHHTFGMVEQTGMQDPWPFDATWDKRKQHDRMRQLEIAGALIAAEIDRLERKGQ